MADQSIIDAIKEGFKQVAGLTGNSTPSGGGGAGGGSQQAVGYIQNAATQLANVAKEAVPLYFGFERLTKGADVTATAISGLSTGLNKIGLGAFGTLIGATGEELIKQKTNLDSVNKETGAAGLNIGRFVRMAGEAGVTTEQFGNIIKNSNGSLMGLGLNSSHSAEVFSKVNRQLIESDIGGKLMQAGLSSEDMAKYTAISLTNTRRRDLTTAEGQAAVQKSAAAFSQSLLEASAMTGQNRDTVAGNIKATLESTDNTLAMMNMSQKEADAFTELTGQISKTTPGLSKMVDELYNNGGVITKSSIDMQNAMGPAAGELQKHVAQLKASAQAGDEEGVRAAKKAIERDQAEALMYQANQSKLGQRTANMEEGMSQAQNQFVQGSRAYALNLKTAMEESGGNLDLALEKMRKDAANQTQGKTGEGKDDAGARVAMAMNEANHRATIQAGGMAQAFEKAADKVGNNAKALDLIQTGLNSIGAPGGKMDQAADKFLHFTDKATAALNSAVSGGKAQPGTAPVNEASRGAGGKINIIPKTGKADGGDIDENTEYIVGEEGPEKIRLAKPGIVTPNKEINNGINLAEISKTISTTISSSTGGGSTTTSRVQNDDSKRAEKELQTTKEQYATERQALLEKTRAEMGPDASRGDVRRAINGSEEGKALEEKYKAAMDPLYKRIESGISWEVSTKQEAAEETKKTVEQTVTNTKNASDAVSAIRINEIAETLKQADLQKSVIGKSVKDMSDDMLASMLPKGTTVEDYYEDMNGNLASWATDAAAKIKEKAEESKTVVVESQTKIAEIIKKSATVEQTSRDESAAETARLARTKNVSDENQSAAETARLAKQNTAGVTKVDPMAAFDNLFGGIANKLAPLKTAESKSAEVASKSADLKKAPDQSDAETKRLASASAAAKAKSEEPKTKTADKTKTQDTSLKDLNDQLTMLNKQMGQLISYNSEISEHTKTTARAKPAGQRS